MKLKCPKCGQTLEAMMVTPSVGPATPLPFFPFHRVGWPMTSSRRKWSTCERTYMRAKPEHVVGPEVPSEEP